MFDWGDEQVEMLIVLWADGLSAGRIAAKIGAPSRSSVIGKVHRLKLPGRRSGRISADDTTKPKHKKVNVPRIRRARNAPDEVVEITDLPFDSSPCAVTLLELQERSCRWPLGDPSTSQFRFCGAEQTFACPYCARHARLAYQQAPRPRRQMHGYELRAVGS